MEHHMANGMMALVQYEGAVPTGPAAAFFDPGGAAPGPSGPGHASHSGGEPATAAPVAPTATAAPSAGPPAGVAAVVAMVDDRFEPNDLTVAAGSTVTWINNGQNWHSLAAFDGSFESGKVDPGQTWAHRFDAPGTYDYICKHHGLQGMLGRLTVT